MAASSRDAIVKMAKKLLQRPQGDPDEVQRLADETINAVVQSSQAYSGGGQRLKGKQAAQASACVVAALQCAGWLVQAAWGLKRQVNEGTCTEARKMRLHVRMGDAHAVSGKCIEEATTWAARLDMGQVGLDLLRAVTRPAAGDRVPGEPAADVAAGDARLYTLQQQHSGSGKQLSPALICMWGSAGGCMLWCFVVMMVVLPHQGAQPLSPAAAPQQAGAS
jgi:hypothetical protein